MAEEKQKSNKMIGCAVFVVLIMIIAVIVVVGSGDGDSDSGSTQKEESIRDLNASIRFTGTQFVITNNDSFDWTDVKLEVNSQGLRSGYILRSNVIEAGTTYTVGAMQFAKKNGEKFNPFTHKPTNFSIWCDTPGGKNGSYYGAWD